MRRKRLLFAMAFLVIGALGGNLYAQISWESKTNLIQNPSFESSTAASDLTTGSYSDGTLDGWTVSGGWSNAQYGVANASTKIQGIGTSFSSSDGDNYFFTRNNWNANTTYLVSQTIDGGGGNLPTGFYKLTCQTATYSSTATLNTIQLSLQESGKDAAITNGIVLSVWNEWGVIVYKSEESSNLKIEAKMIPGSAAGGNHFCLLLDDFKLEYISPDNAMTASESNVIDFTALINNANIYNHASKTNLPRGWSAFSHTTGNGNYTENTGDTQLEGWSGGNLNIDYYQDIISLPKGAYNVTAHVHSTNNSGEVYINESGNKKTSPSMSSDFADLTTESLKVTGGHISMGIQANTTNSWVTGDNFRLSMVAPCIETIACLLPSSGEMEANKWYYIDFPAPTTASAQTGEILYTQDGEELASASVTDSFSSNNDFEAGRYYLKSSTANKLVSTTEPLEGWEDLTTLPTDLNDYFYTFYQGMLGLKLDTGNEQGSQYKTLWYTSGLNPEEDKNGLMTIVNDNGYQVITCANEPNYMLQTEYNAAQFLRTHDNGGGDIGWGHMTLNYTDGSWTVTNGVYPDAGSWGAWNGTATNGAEIAANKTEDEISHYQLHAIKRGQYLQKVLTADFYNREDISYVITNPEAERRSTVGWTLSEDGAFGTQNNTALGNKTNSYYFEKWQQSGNLSDRSMSQALTDLKEGYYTLEVNTNVSDTGAYLYVNGEQVDLSENVDGVASVKVHVDANGTLEYGVKLEGYTHNWVAFDNFKLYYSTEDPLVEDGIYYLYSQWDDNGSNDEHRFLARGKNWGTRAVIDEYGIPVQITNQGDDIVTLKFVDTNKYIKETWWLYTDGGENSANTFKVLTSTVSGLDGYHFATMQIDDAINRQMYMYTCVKDASSDDYYAVAGNGADEVEGDFSRTVWKLLSPAERNAIVDSYPASNAKRVFDAAKEGDIYTTFPSENVSDDQLSYWMNAEYEVQDKTDLIGTPSFENGSLGDWTYTPVRNGDPTFGSGLVELYQKVGTFSQTITGLDEGIYKLTVNAFERHGNSDADKGFGNDYGNIGSAYLSANGEKVHIAAWHEAFSDGNNPNSMGQAAAKFEAGNYENEVYVYVGSDGNLTINVGFPGYMEMAEWFIMNNFTLTYYAPSVKTIATPEGKYYLRNKGTGEYMTFDGFWGTYYSMGDAGKELTLETSTDGFTIMHTTYLSNSDDVESNFDTENYFYSYPRNPFHAFSNGNSTGGGEKWVFYEIGENSGLYNIMNYMTGNYLSGEQGYDESNLGWGGLLKEVAASDDESVQWELVSFDDLYAALTANGASYPQNASFLIGEPDLIAGFNNVYEEFYRWKVMGNDQFKYSSWNDENITTFKYYSNGISEGNSTIATCLAADYPDILQTIENVPAGLYVVECQAVFRDGQPGDASDDPSSSLGSSSRKNQDRLNDGTYVNRAYLYANENMAAAPEDDAMAMRDRTWIYENAQLMPVNIATTTMFDIDNVLNPDVFVAFRDQTYPVRIPIYVSDSNGDGTGTLTIGVLQEIGINENLLAFDRFRLTYYGTNYTGTEVKEIALGNLQRLATEHNLYQSNTITTKEVQNLTQAIQGLTLTPHSSYNQSSEIIAQANKAAQNYGETSICLYIYNVLKTDYDNGAYTTASDQNRTDGYYPYVDEECKENVVNYFGADPSNTNNKNVYTGATYSGGSLSTKTAMFAGGQLSDLHDAISALRMYVEANAEARYIEDEKVIDNEIADTEEARAESRMARMALLTGSQEAITTDDGKYPAYKINPLMFGNTGAEIKAPELDKIVKNRRCWAPRDAYGHRFYDYKNYYHWGAGQESTYEIEIDGLMTGKYLVTISESHNNALASVRFNAFVGENQIVTDKELFRADESVWQTYTHSWQDVSCVAEITDQFEPVTLQFTGGGENSGPAATMNICNLRIYRLDDVEMLLLDENDTQLAKNGDSENGYNSVKVLLKREMQTDQWNTLTLPVSLTKEQVISGFGEGTILAVMDGFATDYESMFNDSSEYPDNCIHFKTNDLSELADEDIAIEEGKVYLIKPTADPAVAAGETAKYKNPHEGQPIYIDVEGPIYYLDYVKYTLTQGDEGKECYIVEKDPETGEIMSTTVRTHSDPEAGTPIEASGAQSGKLSLQMDGTYVTKVVPVGENDYVYAFQNQSGTVNVVQLDPQYSKTYDGFGDTVGRKFKGFRGWATANYSGDTSVKSTFTVILNDEDDIPTIIRGIDNKDGYSEIKLSNQGIYDLQGRRIESELFNSPACPKGVYIVNGKKVLVK